MIQRLLVAFDGSEQSKKAFAYAIDLATRYSARVYVLSVVQPPEPVEAIEAQAVLRSLIDYCKSLAEPLRQEAAAAGVNPEFEVRVGHPAEQIVVFAKQEEVDTIVMGNRGRSHNQRWLLGSIARRVMNYAECTVTVVR